MDQIDETLPEVVKRFLRSGARLEEIRLDAQGHWTHEGLDFENQRIVDLFNRSISRTPGGTWVLEVGRFTYPIEVEDAAFFVERIDLTTDPVEIALSDGSTEALDRTTLAYEDGGRLYCSVKDGAYRARFLRNAYYAVAEHIEEADGGWVLTVGGRTTALG